MGILERVGAIMSSNVNALLDKCEDPSKMADQLLRESRERLAECRKQTAEVMSVEKQAKQLLDGCDSDIARYKKAAENAIRAGEDEDARKLIEKKQAFESKRAELASNYDTAHANAEKLKQAHDKLVEDIKTLEARKDVVKAKMATANAQKAVNKAMAGMSSAADMSAFARMEEKADRALHAAEAEAELQAGDTGTEDLAAKYASGAGSGSVDDELARMKAELGQN